MVDEKKYKPPSKSASDALYALVKGVIGEAPLGGSIGSELFGLIIAAPFQKRQEAWMNAVSNGLIELFRKDETILERLQNDPHFITILTNATYIVMRNHQKEKLSALQNVVLNAASGIAIEDSIQYVFLSYIDYFTPHHLMILTIFENPRKWLTEKGLINKSTHGGSPRMILEWGIPDYNKNPAIYMQMVEDLTNRGLLDKIVFGVTMTATGLEAPRLTELGKAFLSFIKKPQPS